MGGAELASIFVGSLQRAPWGWALLVVVILALIKVWPILAAQAIEARAKIRGEKREDLAECHRKCDELSDKFHHLELKLLGAISAYRILDAEVEAELPGNTALAQARLVMSAAFTLSPSTPTEGAA